MFSILASIFSLVTPMVPMLLGMFKTTPAASTEVVSLLTQVLPVVQTIETAFSANGPGQGAAKLAALHQVLQVGHTMAVTAGQTTQTYDEFAPLVEQIAAVAVAMLNKNGAFSTSQPVAG